VILLPSLWTHVEAIKEEDLRENKGEPSSKSYEAVNVLSDAVAFYV